jgi:hypothetical protein
MFRYRNTFNFDASIRVNYRQRKLSKALAARETDSVTEMSKHIAKTILLDIAGYFRAGFWPALAWEPLRRRATRFRESYSSSDGSCYYMFLGQPSFGRAAVDAAPDSRVAVSVNDRHSDIMRQRASEDQYSDAETERRATDALRRALTTPYKPQSKLVGKTPRAKARKRQAAKDSPKSS